MASAPSGPSATAGSGEIAEVTLRRTGQILKIAQLVTEILCGAPSTTAVYI